MNLVFRPAALAVAISMLLSGCAPTALYRDDVIDEAKKVASTLELPALPASGHPNDLVVDDDTPYVGAVSIPVSRDAALPPVLRDVTFSFPDKMSLAQVAEYITVRTRVPVRISADCFLDMRKIVGAAQSSAPAGAAPAAGTGAAGAATPAPSAGGAYMALPAPVATGENYSSSFRVDFTGSLDVFLDRIANQAGINWEYRDGAIQFYRVVTRVLTLRTPMGNHTVSMQLNKSGANSSGDSKTVATGSGANSNMQISGSFPQDVWDRMEKELKPLLSSIGSVSVNRESGSIVIRDIRENVDAAAEVVAAENRKLSRVAAIRARVVRVQINGGDQQGVNWTAVVTNIQNAATATLRTPTSLVASTAGSIGLSIVDPTNRWNGSQLVVNALATVGTILDDRTVEIQAFHGVASIKAIANSEGYLASTTPASGGSGSSGVGVPGLTPGTVTTGITLMVLPQILDSNQMILRYQLDLSSNQGFKTVSTGSGETLQQIQTPNIQSAGGMETALLRQGETKAMAYVAVTNSLNENKLMPQVSSGLFGSYNGSRAKDYFVLMLSPSFQEE